MKNIVIFTAVSAIGMYIGGNIAACIFFGLITLLGFVVMVESIGFLRFLVYKSNAVIDILLFIFTLFATVRLGVTIAGGFTVAGLGYSMIYAPYMRERIKKERDKKKYGKASEFDVKY